jgi:hypothetical protein
MKRQEQWKGTATELYRDLCTAAQELNPVTERSWPGAPNCLGRRLRLLVRDLTERGRYRLTSQKAETLQRSLLKAAAKSLEKHRPHRPYRPQAGIDSGKGRFRAGLPGASAITQTVISRAMRAMRQ